MIENNDLKDFILKAIGKNKSEEPKKKQTFMEYVKSDDGIKKLLNLGSLAVASNQSPYVASSIASGIKERRLAREKAKKEQTNNFGLDEISKYLDILKKSNDLDSTKGNIVLTQDQINNLTPTQQASIKNGTIPPTTYIDFNLENQDAKDKFKKSIIENRTFLSDINNAIQETKDNSGLFAKSGPANVLGLQPKIRQLFAGADTDDLRGTLEKVSSQKFMDTLKNLRSDKTGATGLGALSEIEFKLLLNAVGAIGLKYSQEKNLESLNTIKNILKLGEQRLAKQRFEQYKDKPSEKIIKLYEQDEEFIDFTTRQLPQLTEIFKEDEELVVEDKEPVVEDVNQQNIKQIDDKTLLKLGGF
jgi:hypothetical protein